MSDVRQVAKNALALSTTSASRILLGAALQVYIANTLGTVGLGKYAIILAFIHIFQVVAELGLPALVVREAARRPTETAHYLYATLIVQGLAALGSWLILSAVALFMRYPADTTRLIILSGALLFPRAFASACETMFQARERMEFIALVEMVGNAAQLTLAIWLISAGHGTGAFVAIMIGPQALMAALSMGTAWRLGWLTPLRLDLRFAGHLARAAADFYLISLAIIVFSRLDVLFISKLLGERATGLYNAAYQIARVFNLVATSYSDAIYPALSRLFQGAPDRFALAGRKALHYGLLAVLPIAAGTTVLAKPLIGLIYDPAQYGEAVPILQILIWLCIPYLVSAILSRLLLAGERQRLSRQIALWRLVAAVVYYTVLILLFGLSGAALATVAAVTTGGVLNWRAVSRQIMGLGTRQLFAKPLLAVAVMAAIVFLLDDVGLFPSIAVGGGIYLVLLVLLRALNGDDWLLLRQLTGVRGRRTLEGKP